MRKITEKVVSILNENELVKISEHKKEEKAFLIARNMLAGAAVILFALSLILHSERMKGIAYFVGAGAYFFEMLVLTDGFRKKVPRSELFMAYCFGPMYILLGLSYLL